MTVQINGSGTITGVYNFPMTQCKLVASSSTALALNAFNGNQLYVGGQNQIIPNPSITLSSTGLTVGTLYYVYAWMNGATMTLEASTTVHQTDPLSGIEIKLSDPTRTLVGMARIVTGPFFQDSQTQRFTASYYNRSAKPLFASIPSTTTTTSNTAVTINGLQDLEFICWTDETNTYQTSFPVQHGSINGIVYMGPAFDSHAATTATNIVWQSYAVTANGTLSQNWFAPSGAVLTEGYHYWCTLWYVSSGTGTAVIGGYHIGQVRI